jgi:membrane protease subunit (stomatin/prohibitin family)
MLQNKLKEQLCECSIPEKKELINDSLENVQSCFTIMKKWITEIEDEIARVTAAGTSIATNDTEELRSAFKEYVLSDTAFSVKNITMALYDFDELIASAKKFVGKV